MHDIKYFFLNKINQTIQRAKKNFMKGQITESIIKKYYFSKFEMEAALIYSGSATGNGTKSIWQRKITEI
jgi:hypothetical protein